MICGCSSSGPRAGFGEIRLPAVQAGSSIMPGKINPVIPETVSQVAYLVIGHDLTVTIVRRGRTTPAQCVRTNDRLLHSYVLAHADRPRSTP